MQNRIIKFRAWDNNKMTYNPIAYDEWTTECQPLNPVIKSIQNRKEYPQILMQFTELLDKNGKEIYERDIVKMFWQHDSVTNFDYEFIGEVEFCCEWGQWQVRQESHGEERALPFHSFEREELCETEIIGNIFENPELLNLK